MTAILRATAADEAVARALLAKGNVVFAEVRQAGVDEGVRQAILDLCEVLGIEVSAGRRAALAGMGPDRLLALKDHVKRTRSWDD